MTRLGYLSPVWSRDLAIRLLQECEEESLTSPCTIAQPHKACPRSQSARKGRRMVWRIRLCREFDTIPYAYFLPILQDEGFAFLEEEPLPKGTAWGI